MFGVTRTVIAVASRITHTGALERWACVRNTIGQLIPCAFYAIFARIAFDRLMKTEEKSIAHRRPSSSFDTIINSDIESVWRARERERVCLRSWTCTGISNRPKRATQYHDNATSKSEKWVFRPKQREYLFGSVWSYSLTVDCTLCKLYVIHTTMWRRCGRWGWWRWNKKKTPSKTTTTHMPAILLYTDTWLWTKH